MKTHFIGLAVFHQAHQRYEEVFVNLSEVVSVAFCTYNRGHSLVTMPDETAFMVKGTPREILDSIYNRVPRDSMSITYAKEEELCPST